jgi:hypothetical protein
MSEIVADPPDPSCYLLFSGSGIEEFQSVGPDPFLHRARDARGRFAKGSSGNPSGRPRGITNTKRRVPDLAARPLSAGALSNLIERRPYLLRPLAAQLLPPPLPSTGPAKHLGIDLSSSHTLDDLRQVLSAVLAAVARGEVSPAEAAHIARRITCPTTRRPAPRARRAGEVRRKPRITRRAGRETHGGLPCEAEQESLGNRTTRLPRRKAGVHRSHRTSR